MVTFTDPKFAGWQLVVTKLHPAVVHTMPIEDIEPHCVLGCHCGPKRERYDGGGSQYIHNALDGRGVFGKLILGRN